MTHRLLILGAGIYGLVAREIAEQTQLFSDIAFVDDGASVAPDGSRIVGTTDDLSTLAEQYGHAVVAIGRPEVRLRCIEQLTEAGIEVISLISPRAYVSASATLGCGCIVEPMAVIHARASLGRGVLVSAGAVVNHGARLEDGVHVDCGAVIDGFVTVEERTKVPSGTAVHPSV